MVKFFLYAVLVGLCGVALLIAVLFYLAVTDVEDDEDDYDDEEGWQ